MNPQNPNSPSSDEQAGQKPDEVDVWGDLNISHNEHMTPLPPQIASVPEQSVHDEDLFGHVENEHDHDWHQPPQTEKPYHDHANPVSDPWPYDTRTHDAQAYDPHNHANEGPAYEQEANATDQSWRADIAYEDDQSATPNPPPQDYLNYQYRGDEDLGYDPPPSLESGTYAPQADEPFSYVSPAKTVKDRAPITLLLSAIFLVLLLIAVVVFYKSDINDSALKEIGTPLTEYSDEMIDEAKPLSDLDMKDVVGVQMRPSIGSDISSSKSSSSALAAAASSSSTSGQSTSSASKESKASASSSQSTSSDTQTDASKSTSNSTSSVQIGAFNSKEVAQAQFDKVARKYGGQLNGTVRRIDAVMVGGTTYYRASFSGFASKDQARQFCNSLRTAGQDCIIK